MKRIDSIQNEQVKAWKKLQTRKGREKADKFLIEGYHLVEEALKANIIVDTLLITDKVVIPQAWSLEQINLFNVSDQVINELAETEAPQGIIAIGVLPSASMIESLTGSYLLIDRVQDPGNMGTMIRTADSAGIAGIILGEGCVDPYNSKVIRSSQGSLFHIPIVKGNLLSWIERLKEASIPVYGTSLDGASVYSTIEKQLQFGLIMGNEGEGVAKELLELTAKNIYIPIRGQAESLNVAVATGILLYHLITE